MANPAELNLHPILQAHYQSLSGGDSSLKTYYDHPEVMARVKTVYVNALKRTVPKTAAAGGVLGVAVAWAAGLGIPATVLSALGGGLGGVAAGVGYETVKLAVQIRMDEGYKNWKNSVEESILADFERIIDSHPPFADLRCVITEDFPQMPVRDAHGKLYNQADIFEWIDKKGTNPFTREPMTKEDVTFCPRFAPALRHEMGIAFGELSHLVGQDRGRIIQGLKAALRSVVQNHNAVVLSRAIQEQQNAIQSGLSPEEINKAYQDQIAAFVHFPEAAKLDGLAAILTIESIQDINLSLAPKVGRAVGEVIPELAPKSTLEAVRSMVPGLAPRPHFE